MRRRSDPQQSRSVTVSVAVGVSVGVAVTVAVAVGVSLGKGPLATSTINSAGFAPSRLEKIVIVPLVPTITKSSSPAPVIKEVRSIVVQVPALNGPELPRLAPTAGALA